MKWSRGFTYIFDDGDWTKKILVGAFITSIPVVESITEGYQMKVIENIKAGHSRPLPEWTDMGEMFAKGFKLWLAISLFYIPSIIISVSSWILGIPLFIGLLINFIATSMSENHMEASGIAFLIRFILIPVLQLAITGIAVFISSIMLPAVFFFVPAMVLRCQETNSIISTLNMIAHFRFVLKHLGDYIISLLCVFAMLLLMDIIAAILGGATFWIAGIGALIGWFIFSAARFWAGSPGLIFWQI